MVEDDRQEETRDGGGCQMWDESDHREGKNVE